MADTVRLGDLLAEHPVVARVAARWPETFAGEPLPTGPVSLRCASLLAYLGDAMVGEWARTADDPLRIESTADLLVIVEAGVVAACDAALGESDLPGVGALNTWRVRRDTARAVGDALRLVDPAGVTQLVEGVSRWWRAGPHDTDTGPAEEAADWLLRKGRLADVLDGIADGLPEHVDAYLAPACDAMRRLVPRIAAVAAEDYAAGNDGARAGLAYLLDPLSACHTARLLIGHAAARLADGDARAATVARRWCYARVRDDTLEGLSDRHLDKSRLVVAGQPVPPPQR